MPLSGAATSVGGGGGILNKSVAAVVALRGEGVASADASGFAHADMYARWQLDPLRVVRHWAPCNRDQRSATCWANSQACVRPLAQMLHRAQGMFDAEAFVHHYYKAGLEAADFENTFVNLEQVLLNYRKL